MARTDTLTNYLTDVATAIKTKKGDNTPIKASEFDTEIANLPSGGGDISDYLETTITDENGQYFFAGGIFKKIPENFVVETKNLTSLFHYFRGKTVPKINVNGIEKVAQMYQECQNVEEIEIADLSEVTSTSNLFYNCKKVRRISPLNLPNVKSCDYMYYNCYSLENILITNFGKPKNINYIFNGCKKVASLFEIDCSLVTELLAAFNNMGSLIDFGGCKNLGQSYQTSMSANYTFYKLDLSTSTLLTEQSLINVLNGLYDIASIGVKTQSCVLGSTNLAKLTSEEGQQALANATAKGWSVS